MARQVRDQRGTPCTWDPLMGQWVAEDLALVPSTELQWPRPMGWSEADVLEMPYLWEDGLPLSEVRGFILAPIVESPTPMPPAHHAETLSERRVAA